MGLPIATQQSNSSIKMRSESYITFVYHVFSKMSCEHE